MIHFLYGEGGAVLWILVGVYGLIRNGQMLRLAIEDGAMCDARGLNGVAKILTIEMIYQEQSRCMKQAVIILGGIARLFVEHSAPASFISTAVVVTISLIITRTAVREGIMRKSIIRYHAAERTGRVHIRKTDPTPVVNMHQRIEDIRDDDKQ